MPWAKSCAEDSKYVCCMGGKSNIFGARGPGRKKNRSQGVRSPDLLQTIRVKKEFEVLALKSRPYPKWTQCAVMNTKWALEGHQGDYRLMPEYTWEKSRFHLFLHKMWKLPFTKKIDQKLFIYVHCNALYIVHCSWKEITLTGFLRKSNTYRGFECPD